MTDSEDERIRKSLIRNFTNQHSSNFPTADGFTREQILAWLEKQGEKKSTDNLTQQEAMDIAVAKCFNEQKAVDKVEPKFNVGDWCIDNEDGTIFQIVKVLDNTYTYKTNEGKEYSCTHYSLENDARLWTIADAKCGDVLVASDESLFIFARAKGDAAYYHFSLCKNGSQEISDGKYAWEVAKDCYPATKEQYDTLMKAMADAGYTFDFEKKELKKIEHNIQLTEFEDAVKDMMDDYRDVVGGNDVTIEEVKKHAAYMLSLIHQNPVNWSEEDEDMIQALNACIDAVIKSGMNYISFDSKSILIGKVKNWLKSLRPQNY